MLDFIESSRMLASHDDDTSFDNVSFEHEALDVVLLAALLVLALEWFLLKTVSLFQERATIPTR